MNKIAAGYPGVTFQSPDEDSLTPKCQATYTVKGGDLGGFSPLTRIRLPQRYSITVGSNYYNPSFSPLTRIRLPQSFSVDGGHDHLDRQFQSPDEDSLTPKGAKLTNPQRTSAVSFSPLTRIRLPQRRRRRPRVRQ